MKKAIIIFSLAAALGGSILAHALLVDNTEGLAEIARDGRFIAYDNGTVLDTKTRLMWAAKDNGSNVNWANAKSYCDKYRGGGYRNWRMPMPNELAEIYDEGKPQINETAPAYQLYLTELIHITASGTWASPTRGSEAATFNFHSAYGLWLPKSDSYNFRALPVRYYK